VCRNDDHIFGFNIDTFVQIERPRVGPGDDAVEAMTLVSRAALRVLASVGCGLLVGCSSLFGAGDRRPTLDELRNASITGIADEPITLKGGVYDASRLRVTLWADLVAFGDLDGVAPDEAASLLSTDAGGSGSVVYVAVFRTHGDRVITAGTALVGDRTRVRALGVVDRTVTLDVVEAGPADAMCCPSQLARKSYAFRDGTLTLVSSVVTGTLSLAALAGREWTLMSLDERPLSQGAQPPTIIFDGARVSGFGGCNRYTGQVAENTPGTITVGPLAATKMACPSPAMEVEDRYIAALGSVSRYTFVAGRLLLSGANGGPSQRLLFRR